MKQVLVKVIRNQQMQVNKNSNKAIIKTSKISTSIISIYETKPQSDIIGYIPLQQSCSVHCVAISAPNCSAAIVQHQ